MLLDIKTNCYNKCIFCVRNYWWDKAWIRDLDRIKNKILKSNKNPDDDTIEIWWAEPLNYPYISEVIKYIKDNTNKQIKIKTSWVIKNIDSFDEKIILLADCIEIPIYSIYEDKFNIIVWNKNAFTNYMKFIKKLFILGINDKIKFHLVILNENYQDIKEIFFFIVKKFNAKCIYIAYPKKVDILPEDFDYYKITVNKDIIYNKYRPYIEKWIFRFINF